MLQPEFGQLFGLKGSQISNYENGVSYPLVKVLFLMCKEFNCSMDDLFFVDMSSLNSPSPSNPDGTPRNRNRENAPSQYSGSAMSLVTAATESPPVVGERDVGIRATESPPPKDTEIVNDVGKEKEEIRQLRRQAIETLRRLDILETHVVE